MDGDDVLAAPRVLTVVGQEAVIQVAQEVFDANQDLLGLDGILLSVTPDVVDGKGILRVLLLPERESSVAITASRLEPRGHWRV